MFRDFTLLLYQQPTPLVSFFPVFEVRDKKVHSCELFNTPSRRVSAMIIGPQENSFSIARAGECFKVGGSVVVVSFSSVTGDGDLNWSLCLMGDDVSGGLQRVDVLALGLID